MNGDDFKAKFIDEMKRNNGENLRKATEEIGKALGGKTEEIQAIVNDDKILNDLVKNISPSDLQKIGQVINNPELLKLILGSEKGKKTMKDFFNQ